MDEEEKRAMKVLGGLLLIVIFIVIPIEVIVSFILTQFGY